MTVSSTPLVSVIIPAWNSAAFLPVCLAHLKAQTFKTFEVIVVDNGSSDDYSALFRQYRESFPLDCLRLEENRGFAAASNLGAKRAKGAWLAFLNADAFPAPDWLDQFVKAAKDLKEAGAFCSLLAQAQHPQLLDGTGDVYHCSGMAWKGGHGYPIGSAPKEPVRVFSANGAAAFYRRDVFLEVGGFDEDFFSFYEDVDLGFRLNLYGYETRCLPEVKAVHVGSSGRSSVNYFSIYYRTRNSQWAYLKNMPGALFWLFLPAYLFAGLVFFVDALRRGQGSAYLRARWDALRETEKFLKKRKAIQRARKASLREIYELINKKLFAPYTLGVKLRRHQRKARVDEAGEGYGL